MWNRVAGGLWLTSIGLTSYGLEAPIALSTPKPRGALSSSAQAENLWAFGAANSGFKFGFIIAESIFGGIIV